MSAADEPPVQALRILVCAYACDPVRGSEHGVGWDWVRLIAQDHEVWLITEADNEARIVAEVARRPEIAGRVEVVPVPRRPWHFTERSAVWRWIEDSPAKPLMHFAYVAWQRDAHRLAQRLVRRTRFDLVHQLTYVGFRFPGRLWRLGLPFVWGPVGGLENVPWRLLPELGLVGAAEFAGRNMVNSVQKALLRSPRTAAHAAGPGLIAATSGMAEEMRRNWGMSPTVITEVTPPEPAAHQPAKRAPGEPLRIAWAGRHQPAKALPLLLRALSRLEANVPWRLEIFGDGPMTGRWRRKARQLGLQDRCTWHGALPRAEFLAHLGTAHLFVITSLKDLTSTVLLEAIAQGIPVVCPDLCGFRDVVTPDCGITIPPANRQALESGFSDSVTMLSADEPKRHAMGEAALRRASHFMPDAKRRDIAEVYGKALAC